MIGKLIGLALALPFVAACGDDAGQSSNSNNYNANQNGTVCDNGVLEPGEQCDQDGASSDTDPDACRTERRTAHCGDGVQDTGEGCDEDSTSQVQEGPSGIADSRRGRHTPPGAGPR